MLCNIGTHHLASRFAPGRAPLPATPPFFHVIFIPYYTTRYFDLLKYSIVEY